VDERCSGQLAEVDEDLRSLGCVWPVDGDFVVYTTARAVPHELTHVVRLRNELSGPRLFEEGVARLLEASDTRTFGMVITVGQPWGYPTPSTLFGLSGLTEFLDADGAYVLSSHFNAWLRQTYGEPTYYGFLRDPVFASAGTTEDVAAAFAEYFDGPIEEVEQRYFAETPESFSLGSRCAGRETIAFDDAGLAVYEGRLDCDDVQTFGTVERRLTLGACLWPEEAAYVEIRVEATAGSATLSRSYDCSGDSRVDDLPIDLEAGSSTTLALAACEHEIRFAADAGSEAIEFRVELREREPLPPPSDEPCDPLNDTVCGEADLTCRPHDTGTGCLPSGTRAVGESCEVLIDDCVAGAQCATAPFVPGCTEAKCCTPLCDVTMPADCPEGGICTAVFDTPPEGLEALGVCVAPPS
jgi:hypothetical protein